MCTAAILHQLISARECNLNFLLFLPVALSENSATLTASPSIKADYFKPINPIVSLALRFRFDYSGFYQHKSASSCRLESEWDVHY